MNVSAVITSAALGKCATMSFYSPRRAIKPFITASWKLSAPSRTRAEECHWRKLLIMERINKAN